MTYVLFDIGGTKTRVAVSKDLQSFGEPVKFETPNNFDEGIKHVVGAARDLLSGDDIAGAAGGVRGILDKARTKLLSEVVLTDWVGKDIASSLEDGLGTEVVLENDAAVVGLGEAVFGAGKGFDIVAYHTVSTGVGGARIERGRIDNASYGFEPGKQTIDIDQTLFPNAASNMLEDLVSGSAMELRFKKKAYEVPQDDPVWDELAGWLAYGLKNTIAYWSPDAIVLGGSMIVGDPRILREDIVRHTKEVLGDTMPCPEILDAQLGDEGGLYGAMALLAQKND